MPLAFGDGQNHIRLRINFNLGGFRRLNQQPPGLNTPGSRPSLLARRQAAGVSFTQQNRIDEKRYMNTKKLRRMKTIFRIS